MENGKASQGMEYRELWRLLMAWAFGVALGICAVLGGGGCMQPLPLDRAKLVAGPTGWEDAAAATCADFSTECPPIYWYGPESMDCLDGGGFVAPATGDCVTGLQGSDGILLGILWDGQLPHETGLVHEIAHWAWDDPGHANRKVFAMDTWGFPDNYVSGTRVGDRNAALAGH